MNLKKNLSIYMQSKWHRIAVSNAERQEQLRNLLFANDWTPKYHDQIEKHQKFNKSTILNNEHWTARNSMKNIAFECQMPNNYK